MTTQTIPLKPDGVVQVEQVGGDLKVQGAHSGDLQAEGEHVRVERRSNIVTMSSSGDLVLTVPRTASVSTGTIGGDALFQDLTGSLEIEIVGGDLVLRNLTGSVRLSGPVGGATQVENVSNLSMGSTGRGPAGDPSQRFRAKVDAAMRRAESRLRRAEARAAVHTGHVAFRWGGAAEPSPAAPAAPAGEPVGEEERLAILRMLQEKKITSEQADQLLAALEGKA